MNRRTVFLIFCSFLMYANCNQFDDSAKIKEDQKIQDRNRILLSVVRTNQIPNVDCIYCTNTQAFQGNCTCYTSIRLDTCQGLATGPGKSNSQKISCSSLISEGIWVPSGGTSFSCSFATCPPEAYRAAFTSNGR